MHKMILAGAALALSTTAALADSYKVTVTNNLAEELFAPIVVTDAANDGKLFTMGYVTAAAESQILSGDPAQVVEAIGADMVSVGHGMDGPPGVLLAPGKSVEFTVESDAAALRVLAMIAPTMVPDNYVSALIDLSGMAGGTFDLNRYDIGYDEETKAVMPVAQAVGTVTISAM